MTLFKYKRRTNTLYQLHLIKLLIFYLLFDKIGCESSVNSFAPCSSALFQCRDGSCLPKSFVCDGRPECPDESDELPELCANYTTNDTKCSENEFECSKGNCVPRTWLCDAEEDCPNKADEDPQICEHIVCSNNRFTCRTNGNGTNCIPLSWVCDGKKDCEDNSDERSCNATCTSEQFTCASSMCILSSFRCDGEPDCDDGSDELDCPKKTCPSQRVACSGKCIPKYWVCDGENDCEDGLDEQNCSKPSSEFPCGEGEVKCKRSLACVKEIYLCDGEPDCPHGEDEECPDQCSEGSFACGDKRCLPNHVLCNGFAECSDGSDEIGCNVTKVGLSNCNPETEFDCGKTCIPLKLACNGKEDCGGDIHSDEAPTVCNRNECEEYNGGCGQICVDKKVGHKCACRKGFELYNGTQCRDINECLQIGLCSQICRNLKGSYKCECVSGYAKDPHDTHKCKAMEGHASLLYADYYDIRKISLDHKEHLFQVTAIVNVTNGSTALDFVFKTGMIFWTDARDRKIYKAPIDEGIKRETVIADDLTNTDGLAVDWLYNHIYWSNSEKNTIEVSDFNGDMQKTLFHNKLQEPRALAIYPLEGWMFWTDWGRNPKIERGGMDGTHRKAIVTRDIRWPNGLTIDFVLRLLYWVDSKNHVISSCKFDGSGRRVILYSPENLPHPFSISVFEDTLYWTDWKENAIFKANKFNGRDIEEISKYNQNPMTVHVYHSYRQPNGTNHCTPLNGLCTHLCLPAPQINTSTPKITCACPDGYLLMADKLTCENTNVFHGLSHFAGDSPILDVTNVELEFQDSSMYVDDQFQPILNTDKSEKVDYSQSFVDASRDAQSSSQLVNGAVKEDGSVAVAAILAAIVVLCLTSLVAYFVYRYYKKRSAEAMNFDNPVYKKTTTTEEGLNLSGSNRVSCGQNGVRVNSQSAFPHRQYGIISSAEDCLEPLTKNHQVV